MRQGYPVNKQFRGQENISQKKYDLCPHVQLQTVVWLFYGSFGAVASSLLSGHSGYVDVGLVLLWI